MGGLQTSSDRANTTNAEQRALVDRILASSLFEKSARLSDFLKYICDRSLNGRPDEVREQFIGHHVFGRPIDYNSADDTIVRVTARQLRAKLRDYFHTYGREERWLVEIPKGGYLPVFRERRPPAPTAGQTTSGTRSDPRPFLLRWAVVLIIAVVVLLFAVAWGWKRAKAGMPRASQAPIASPIADFFAGSKGPVQVVLSDSALVLMQGLTGRSFSLAQYADRTYRAYPKELAKRGLRHYWALLSSRQISNLMSIT